MTKQPSYIAAPGQRSGTGSASVLRFLLKDLAQKPKPIHPVTQRPAARRDLVNG
jgi:hypothetical protein